MEELVIGIGEVLWDELPAGRRLGGAPANFAYHVSRLGLESRVVSAVGNDADGHELLEVLRQCGVKGEIATVAQPTGSVGVSLDADGVPQYDIRTDVAWDNIPFTPALAQLAGRTRAVCFGSLAQRSAVSRDTVTRFLDAMPAGADILKVFDINLRQHFYTPDIIEDSLRRCNILKINDEELHTLGSMLGWSADRLLAECPALMERYGLRLLVLTCGASGSYVFSPEETSFLETPRVLVADTVGAGDSFTAALVSALLRGLPVAEAHHLAVQVSAYVCSQSGAMPELPPEFAAALR